MGRARYFARVANEQPRWLQMVYRLERAVGTPVEKAVRSDTYFDLVAQANRARRRTVSTVQGLQRGWLHTFNLPAASDVRGVREQLARVERRLNELAKELGDGDRPPED